MDAINRGGVSGFLQKPLEGEEVRRALREAIADAHLEQSARRLRAAMSERDRLATAATVRAGLLHDLANTHTAIGAACEKLEALAPDHMTALARDELAHLRAAVDFAVGLLHGRARFLSAREKRTPERHEAGEAIRTVARLLRGQQGSVRLVTHCPEGLEVYADRIDVCRILVNLLTNAFQALESVAGGVVRLEAGHAGADVRFTVSDNGPGVPAELQPLLFTARTPRPPGGGGMGLPLSRALAAANGGALRLHEGSGPCHTTFVLTLPAEARAAAATTGPVALVG
jgi:two-component system C4-dicarboxylate transport sensor histidine kinase DctB